MVLRPVRMTLRHKFTGGGNAHLPRCRREASRAVAIDRSRKKANAKACSIFFWFFPQCPGVLIAIVRALDALL